MTTAEFIEKAKAVHGNKYDYSKVDLNHCVENGKVCIICPKHGEFLQNYHNHLKGYGCNICAGRITNTENFIKLAKEVHGDKYDYSKTRYINSQTKVKIICPIHGEFEQRPNCHIKGNGCPKCNTENKHDRYAKSKEQFIEEARKVHGDKYDYSKVKYINSNTKVKIICPIHGEFEQSPVSHLHGGHGCPNCAGQPHYTTETFIEKAKEIHGDKYDYSKVEYVNAKTDITIICPKHGEFKQQPYVHLNSNGCPKCGNEISSIKQSMGKEEFIRRAKEIHGDRYDYSKVEYINNNTPVCIICQIHGEFWQAPLHHLLGQGCKLCNHGLTKQYKFNLLEEFESEYDFRAFLANNDVNILYVILRNIEPKFDPIKRDIERALSHSNEVDPMKALSDKYTSDSEDELDEDEEEVDSNETEDFEIATAPSIDLDDDNAIDSMVATEETKEADAPTIEDVIKNTDREIKVINKIEHMLTPEDREYIMNKFLNDKRRIWMAARENRK